MVLSRNKSFYLKQRLKYSCKYLTYKEWKQQLEKVRQWREIRKYLTYKEWKQTEEESQKPVRSERTCKYLTYKEWKRNAAFTVPSSLM